LSCAGSSLELKKQYGSGYRLAISKNTLPGSTSFNEGEVMKKVMSAIPDASVEDNTLPTELGFVLPDRDASKFAQVFEELEKQGDGLGVESFGISCTTMEEVFLKVGQTGLPEGDEADALDGNEFLLGKKNVGEDGVSLNSEVLTGCALWMQQFRALFYKRAINGARNKWGLISTILVPVILTFVAFGLAKWGKSAASETVAVCRELGISRHSNVDQTVYVASDTKGSDYFTDMDATLEMDYNILGNQSTGKVAQDALFASVSSYITQSGAKIKDVSSVETSFDDSLLADIGTEFSKSGVFSRNFVGATFGTGTTWITAGCEKSAYSSSEASSAPVGTDATKLAVGVWYSFAFDGTFDAKDTFDTAQPAQETASLSVTGTGDAPVWTTSVDKRDVSGSVDTSSLPDGVDVRGHLELKPFDFESYQADEAAENEENSVTSTPFYEARVEAMLEISKLLTKVTPATLRIKFNSETASSLTLACTATDGGLTSFIFEPLKAAEDPVAQFVPPTTIGYGWYSNQAIHAAPEALNLIGNTIARQHLGKENFDIIPWNCPLPKSIEEQARAAALGSDVFGLCILLMMAMAGLSGSFIVFPINEKNSHAKHVQFVSGATYSVYWIASACWDFVNAFATLVLIMVIAGAFNLDGLSECLALFFASLLLMLWAIIPLQYLGSNVLSLKAGASAYTLTHGACFPVGN